MQQHQPRPGTRPQIAHASAINLQPALFDARAECHADRGSRNFIHRNFIHRQESCGADNRFATPGFYLSATKPLSLHSGELRLPAFFGGGVGWPILARSVREGPSILSTLLPSASAPATSSARESPCPRASPPAETEAGTSPRYPACC